MEKQEFLKLVGREEMPDKDYEKVEAAYSALDNMDKQAFAELYTNDLPELLYQLAQEAQVSKATRDMWKHRAVVLATAALAHRDASCEASRMLGIVDTIKLKTEHAIPLTKEERDYIMEHLF